MASLTFGPLLQARLASDPIGDSLRRNLAPLYALRSPAGPAAALGADTVKILAGLRPPS